MVNFRTTPGGGCLVAALAVARHCGMHGSGGFAGQPVTSAQVAACALCAQGNVLMEQPGVPAGVAGLVASVAVVDRYTGQRLVGYVVGRRSISRWVGSAVAARTLVGHHRLRVVPARRRPARHTVAARAVGRGRYVHRVLARGTGSVVAARASGGCRERAVVNFRTTPGGGCLVAALATRCGCKVAGRLAGGCRAVVAAGAARADCHIGVELGWCPGHITLVAGRAVCSR